MEYETLINIIDDFNYHNIVASLQVKPKNVVFIYMDSDKEKEIIMDLTNFYKEKLPQTNFSSHIIEEVNLTSFEELLGKYDKDKTLVNISGGTKLQSLYLYKAAENKNFKSVIIHEEKDEMLEIKDKDVFLIKDNLEDLLVFDYVKSSGGKIIKDESRFVENKGIKKLIDYVLENYEDWRVLKKIFTNPNIIKHSESNPYLINISLSSSNNYERNVLTRFVQHMNREKITKEINNNKNLITLKFNTKEIKNFLFKTGSWLEVLTHEIVNDINSIKDVKSGVVFLWDGNNHHVKNEVDVLATSAQKLFYISCKDTSHYDEDTLNELHVYSNKIGGEKVRKILVTTSDPSKTSTFSRAKEMDIEIVIFKGNIEDFKDKLKKAIETN
jgi:hypothetical protein